MRIEDLRAFIILADVGSFHAAAEILNITQPALTRRIQKLEQQLDTKLFERTTRHVKLSMSGTYFLEKTRNVVSDIEAAMVDLNQSSDEMSGRIRIGSLPTIGLRLLPGVFQALRVTFPRVGYRLLDGEAMSVIRMVKTGLVDIGFGMRVSAEPELRFLPLLEEPIGIMCHRDADIAKIDNLTWSHLANQHFVYNLGESDNWMLIAKQLAEHGVSLKWVHQIQSLMSAMILVSGGSAVSPIPMSFTPSLNSEILKVLPVTGPEIVRKLYLIERTDSVRSPYVQELVDLLSTTLDLPRLANS